ncbi:HTH-type transcriptional regulator LrpA [Lachnospiraceae bacterium KM106-2]|nr:HTH-type transcriptional regulator LrpA [Lachnospiraceae bacterium KM106-2]
MDEIDLQIIKELEKNCRISMRELGEKVHLTGQAASARVVKLEEMGVVEAFTVRLNHALLGYPVHVMITVYTRSYQHTPYLSFLEQEREYVIHNYKISGDGCYYLECRFPSNEVMDEFIVELNQYVNYKITMLLKDTIVRD